MYGCDCSTPLRWIGLGRGPRDSPAGCDVAPQDIQANLTRRTHPHTPTPPPHRTSSHHSMNIADMELEAGKTAPFADGFDPLGLAKDKSK